MKRQKFELTGDAAKVKRDRVQRRDLNDRLWHNPDLRLAAPEGPVNERIADTRRQGSNTDHWGTNATGLYGALGFLVRFAGAAGKPFPS